MKILKIFLLVLVIIIFLFSLKEIIEDNPAFIINNLKGKDFQSNIQVVKLKFFGIIPVGIAKLENLGIENFEKTKVYHLKATAQVAPYVSKFFKATVQADSYADIKSLSSLKFVQRAQTPGDYDYNREIIYDQKKKVMKIGNIEREIFDNTRDPLSAIFYIRNQEFQKDKEFKTFVNTNQKNYILTAKIIDYKEVKLVDKKIGVWLLSAEVRRYDKSPRHKTSIKIWFLDNKSKTPILIRIMSAGGLITARLIALE